MDSKTYCMATLGEPNQRKLQKVCGVGFSGACMQAAAVRPVRAVREGKSEANHREDVRNNRDNRGHNLERKVGFLRSGVKAATVRHIGAEAEGVSYCGGGYHAVGLVCKGL